MHTIAELGGVIAFLVILHCIGDWIFQWEWMAKNKTSMPMVRFLHCMLYCTPFLPFVRPEWVLFLFGTHFVVDSYKPLYYFRKLTRDPRAKSIAIFKESFTKPDGFFILVTYDQIFHVLLLVPVALWGMGPFPW